MALPSPPSPPPTAMSTPPSTTISGQINAATRKQHTELNRLLMHRLPLALPPHTTTPALYAKGLVPFSQIFDLFETEWNLLARHVEKSTDSEHEREVKEWLAGLRPQGLPRSARIKTDILHLRDVSGPAMFNTPDLGEAWKAQMRQLIREKPHVLVAFAWVFYMAVFSGGRWIRQQLVNGGAGFWLQDSGLDAPAEDDPSALLSLHGFTFLSFDGELDGEDLKAAFKLKLVDAETLLTPGEKQDILDVSQKLFDRSLLLVEELDQVVLKEKARHWAWKTVQYTTILVLLIESLRPLARYSGFW